MNPDDYVHLNRDLWTVNNAAYTDASADEAWSTPEVTWGVWHVPETTLHALPPVAGKDVIELGCGTAYLAAKLKRAGAARVCGVDITPAQLETAARLSEKYGLALELIEANAEEVPLPAETFDVAVSEYGASIWCDPYKWIPEAARLLRPSGELVFLRSSPLALLCSPDVGKVGTDLRRPQRGLHMLAWPVERSVEFSLGHGDMFRLLRESGFDVVDLIEVFAPDDATDHKFYDYISSDWAKQWPSEEIWRARKL